MLPNGVSTSLVELAHRTHHTHANRICPMKSCMSALGRAKLGQGTAPSHTQQVPSMHVHLRLRRSEVGAAPETGDLPHFLVILRVRAARMT